MYWTETKPEDTGYYYFRDNDGVVDICCVTYQYIHNKKQLAFIFIGDEEIYTKLTVNDFIWSDEPIKFPEDLKYFVDCKHKTTIEGEA